MPKKINMYLTKASACLGRHLPLVQTWFVGHAGTQLMTGFFFYFFFPVDLPEKKTLKYKTFT